MKYISNYINTSQIKKFKNKTDFDFMCRILKYLEQELKPDETYINTNTVFYPLKPKWYRYLGISYNTFRVINCETLEIEYIVAKENMEIVLGKPRNRMYQIVRRKFYEQ